MERAWLGPDGKPQFGLIPATEFSKASGETTCALKSNEILHRVFVPYTNENTHVLSFKQGNRRRTDAISILNGCINVE